MIAYLFVSSRVATTPRMIRSVAVLPLQNLSGDSQDFFVDGMTEALIERLSSMQGVRVISRTSVMQFKHSSQSLPEIAKTLRVDAVVEGSVARSGRRVHISAKLIRGKRRSSLVRQLRSRSRGRARPPVRGGTGDCAPDSDLVAGRESGSRNTPNTPAVSPDVYDYLGPLSR